MATTRKACWKVPWQLILFFLAVFLMMIPSVLEVTRRISSQHNVAFSDHPDKSYTSISGLRVEGKNKQTTTRKTKTSK